MTCKNRQPNPNSLLTLNKYVVTLKNFEYVHKQLRLNYKKYYKPNLGRKKNTE